MSDKLKRVLDTNLAGLHVTDAQVNAVLRRVSQDEQRPRVIRWQAIAAVLLVLESARDGEYGFQSCADHADSAELKSIFLRHSQQCAAAAQELEREIRRFGGEPASGGTVAGAVHRGWVSVKAALSSRDDKAVLEECERGEDAAVARYRKALNATLPADVRALLERQAQGAKRNHDEVRALRDRYAQR